MGVRGQFFDSVAGAVAAAAAAAAPQGTAPTIDPRVEYYLLAPGNGRGYDLVNPGRRLPADCCSYAVQVGVHKVRVQLKKKCFEIFDSPPATARCKCYVKPNGKLTVGWLGDIKQAWHIVLGVLAFGGDGHPLSQSAPKTQRATAAANELDAGATAARNESDVTTDDCAVEEDVAEKPTHLNEFGREAVKTLEFKGAPSVSLRTNHSASKDRVTPSTWYFQAATPAGSSTIAGTPASSRTDGATAAPPLSSPSNPGLRASSPRHKKMLQVDEKPIRKQLHERFVGEGAAWNAWEESRVYVVCGTQNRSCGLNTCQMAHVGACHLGSVSWHGERILVLYCSGTGQIINHENLLKHYDCDPVKVRQMAELQIVYPCLFPPSAHSSSSDAEGHGQEREQPEIAAILSNLQPGCHRYFQSGCHDVLQWWCPMFQLRYIFCLWADLWLEEYFSADGNHFFRLQPEGYARTASDILEQD